MTILELIEKLEKISLEQGPEVEVVKVKRRMLESKWIISPPDDPEYIPFSADPIFNDLKGKVIL